MTRREAVERTTEVLAAAGVPGARVEAELLLAEILGCSRPALWLEAQRSLPAEQAAQLDAWVGQRVCRVPLQHLTGRAPFLEWMLQVTSAVLVPRPETEVLARRAMQILQEYDKLSRPLRVLDFATGSGCLAFALAAAHPRAEVHALDVSAAALAVARDNATRLGLRQRIQFHLGDGFGALEGGFEPARARFELIVSNPPYIPTAELETLEPEVRDHDPRLALDGGADGLNFHRRLACEAPAWLNAGGWLLAEFGDGQGPEIQKLYGTSAWESASTETDLSGRERILLVRRSSSLAEFRRSGGNG